MIKKLLLVPAFVSMFCASMATSQTSIERIAPENAIVVAGTKNFQGAMDHLQKTQLWALLQSDQMKELWADLVKKAGEGIDEMLQELGVEKDSLVHPTGPAGFALFTQNNPETGMPEVTFVALADFGDDERANKIHTLIMAALERGEKEAQLEYEEAKVGERTLLSIDLSKLQEKMSDVDVDAMNPMGMPAPDPSKMLEGMKQLHYVRDGHTLLFSSNKQAIEDALDVADGKPRTGGSVADRAEFQATMGKLGESDAFGVVLTRDIMSLIAPMDEMGMAEMMRPMLRSLFGEVQAYGMSMRMDAPSAMVEQTLVAYMPKGKQGLTQLIDTPSNQGALPPFIAPDALMYSHFTFKFSGLMEVIRKVVNSNPMLAAQAGPELDAMAPVVNQVTSMLGTQVHIATSFAKPVTASSQHTLIAVECTKPQEFEAFFSEVAEQGGFEPRDFLGQRIYTMPEEMMQMMMPMPIMGMQSFSLGIGGGYLLLGGTPAVEQGLRATSEPGGGSLSASPEFQRAINALNRNNSIAWGYTDTVDYMEAALAAQKAAMQQMIEQMKEDAAEWGNDEDMAEFHAAMEEQMEQTFAMWEKLDYNHLRRYMGPSAWQVESTEDALIMRSLLLDSGSR